MDKKRLERTAIILSLSIIAFLMMAGLVSAIPQYAPTCSWKAKGITTNGVTISGAAMRLNVSWDNNALAGSKSNFTNITFEYRITGGTWRVLQKKVITTFGNRTYLNITRTTKPSNTTGTEFCFDGKTYEVRARFYNTSGGEPCTLSAITGLICDNTNPKCTIRLPVSSTTYTTGQTFLADTQNASVCYWDVGRKIEGTINGTAGAEDCYYSFQAGDPPETTYQSISLYTKDQSGNMTSCTDVTSVRFDDDEPSAVRAAAVVVANNQRIAATSAQKQKTNNNIIIFFVVIIGIVAYMHYKK